MYRIIVTAALAITCVLSNGALADEQEIKAAIAAYVEAFNNQDLAKLSAMWSEKAVHIDLGLNRTTEGRTAIEQDLQAAFTNHPNSRISGSLEHIMMIRDDIASISGQVVLSDAASAPSVGHFTAVLVKDAGNWMIQKMEETPVTAPADAKSALNKLSWLVGAWEDASIEPPVKSSVNWSSSETFLVRTTETIDDAGNAERSTQIIAWDPRIQQIRSWTFHADGSFGESFWAEQEDGWLIGSNQILINGSEATGTYVMKKISDDSFSIQLLGREIDGEPQPSTELVTVNRIPEAAQEPAPATSN